MNETSLDYSSAPGLAFDRMRQGNTSFTLSNQGKDLRPEHTQRELVQNAIDAVVRAGTDQGVIILDYVLINGIRKSRITDNGIGMTGDEVHQYLNHDSASGGIQAFNANFGVGAKISAFTQNPRGVLYLAWKNGIGTLTHIGRDPQGNYGRAPFPDEEGNVDYFRMLDDRYRFAPIEKQGVSVILLGQHEKHDTTLPPEGVDLPSQWQAAYLDRRYFEFPANITIKVLRPKEIHDARIGGERPVFDIVHGQRYHLDRHSLHRGILDLPEADARVWWWILDEEVTRGGRTWNNRGHVGAIFQGEVYDVRSGQGRLAGLKDYGIYAGHSQIVIYAEPHNIRGANHTRTALVAENGGNVDYSVIGEAFAENMPGEIGAFMSSLITTGSQDRRKRILARSQRTMEVLGTLRFRTQRNAPEGSFADRVLTGTATPNPTGPEGEREPRGESPSQSSDTATKKNKDALNLFSPEQPGVPRRAAPETRDRGPVIHWDEAGTQVPENRAASYTRNTNTLVVSATSPVYRRMLGWAVDDLLERTRHNITHEVATERCESVVREWYEQALYDLIVNLRPLERDPSWGPSALENALNDEALTGMLLTHAHHIQHAVKRAFGAFAGKNRRGPSNEDYDD